MSGARVMARPFDRLPMVSVVMCRNCDGVIEYETSIRVSYKDDRGARIEEQFCTQCCLITFYGT